MELLALATHYPHRSVEPGHVLITDGEPLHELFVLIEGSLRIEKQGVVLAMVNEPGACVGEMSLLLQTPATADVVVTEPSVVAVIEDAQSMLDREATAPGEPGHDDEAGLAVALARLLAQRLQAMTTYLVDIKHQYADHEGGLGMVDVVLGSLMRGSGSRTTLGSDRDPEPEY